MPQGENVPGRVHVAVLMRDTTRMTGEDLKDFIDNKLFPGLQNLEPAGDDYRGVVIRNVFEDAYNYMKSGQLMRQVINKLQDGIDFNKSAERHELGDMYEQILKDLQSAGNAGEFYTPRAVTQFMVNRLDPKLDLITHMTQPSSAACKASEVSGLPLSENAGAWL